MDRTSSTGTSKAQAVRVEDLAVADPQVVLGGDAGTGVEQAPSFEACARTVISPTTRCPAHIGLRPADESRDNEGK
jgi:hypothetical protein